MKKKLNTLDKYIIFCFTMIIIFTVAYMAIFCITGGEAATIAPLFFAVFGGEILMCCLIKKFKLDKQHKDIKEED